MPVPPETGVVIHGQDLPVAEMLERARLAEKLGVDAVWLVQLPSLRDSAAVLAALACVTERVTLGAGVLPFYTRPPVTMAQTALTVDELSGGRFALGVGSGHRVTGEWMLGVPTGPPVGSMREYLSVVTSLIRDGEVHQTGDWYRAHAVYAAPRRAGLPVHLGAFGPRLAELAGRPPTGSCCGCARRPTSARSSCPPSTAGCGGRGAHPTGSRSSPWCPAPSARTWPATGSCSAATWPRTRGCPPTGACTS
nr:hypothetical protein GCM10020093_034400 [Planobispora longispora]